MRASRRHLRAIATLAAFFTLQAPLCAVACLDSPAAASASEASGQHAEQPCHGAPASSPEPTESPTSHDACGCEETEDALTQVADDLRSAGGVGPVCHLASLPDVLPRTAHRVGLPSPNDLPPPDLLLLKSTLIL